MTKLTAQDSALARPSSSSKLGPDFFNRPTLTVAQDLLGAILVRKTKTHLLTGMIAETEAYVGEDDPASHAYGGMTPRNKLMYGPAGLAYVYFIYGNHYCLNFVTEPEGFPAAVLIRALQPLAGLERMFENRGSVKNQAQLCNGPGKLCQALQIDQKLNGISLASNQLFLLPGNSSVQIANSPRIGISQGQDRKWRYYIKNNVYVSNLKGASR
jgi:DNA-3-methyladenine glycosylase